MTRVEDALGQKGRPDVEGCMDGRCFIVELKVADRPKRPATPIRTQEPVKDEQCDWLEERIRAGGRAFILVQVGERHQARRYLLDGRVARKVQAGLTEARLDDLSLVDPGASAESLVGSMAYG